MDKIDTFYDTLIAPFGDGSDGFVQNSSQRYPSTTATQLVIGGSDSHQSAVRSPYDHAALYSLLSNVFKVLTPAQCAFATNVPIISVPANGGSFSFGLSTSQGCAWSAVSQSPWLTVSSTNAGGNTSENIGFSAQPLNGTTPRNGTIQIGNGASYATIFVNQISTICSYSLSVTQETIVSGSSAIPITVQTQNGCAWSAAPSDTWLMVQNGNGTGTGTFTFTVASLVQASGTNPPPALTQPRTGTIDVMGQVLSVTEDPQKIVVKRL